MPRKEKSLSAESPVDVPVTVCSTYLSSSRVVEPPVVGEKPKGICGRKRKACHNPVAGTVVDGDGVGVGMASAPTPKQRKRKSLSAKRPVIVPINNGSSSSSSRVVKTPVTRRKDTVVIADGYGDEDGVDPELCCDICVETRQAIEMIKISMGCSHTFCASCVTKHVETKILENVAGITCPGWGCGSMIEVDLCRGLLEVKLLDRWEKAKCEAAFDEMQKYYCPFKECSAMLVMDGELGNSVKECECPYCHRLFCASCKVPWHWKYTCKQFQSMDVGERGNEDVLVKELAKELKWGRCPKCKFYVERTHGCHRITCRCGFEFCCGCGSDWRGGPHLSCMKR
ncbi:hypothetical protein MLD38_036928 [Melastoma candidum]|uniref:Uncharacterized protein n=1 Tax=Melastoma candidum TaxID=119954 RepID=A0ACB9LLG2_9MYRT|nr:hypothetical protein MLD38_036928 [Melastoma candidum]